MEADSTQNLDDKHLWARFKEGDEDSFALIYENYVGVLYNYGVQLNSDAMIVQDAIQDLFTTLWLTRERLSPTDSIKYYLFRALRRRIHTLYKNSRVFEIVEDEDLSRIAIPVKSTESVQIETETREEEILRLQQALLRLPERQKEVIRLRYFEGFDWDQIGDILEINPQSARNLVQRTLSKLGQLMLYFFLVRFFFVSGELNFH